MIIENKKKMFLSVGPGFPEECREGSLARLKVQQLRKSQSTGSLELAKKRNIMDVSLETKEVAKRTQCFIVFSLLECVHSVIGHSEELERCIKDIVNTKRESYAP
ncbi:hypothetical protein GWI33_005147 [Rhynchophorus ferrugineus]|uniref:Uncharacterized protein n=1 Tax=Rhynchophorus ferrugineus TaxID=354439 RepID=A0A834IJP7_RHYFE|nr:hypothetical protein GWI33_005147 [Rhynchophorus ferrugineus]